MQHVVAELKQAGRSHSSGRLARQWGGAGRLAGLSLRRGEGVPRSPPGAERADGGSSPSLAALARLGAGTRYAKLPGAPLSPTSCQHAYESAVLALGLTSCPPNPQASAHHGAIIAIPTAVRRAMHFGGRARAFCMRGRRGHIRHWRPGHFVRWARRARDGRPRGTDRTGDGRGRVDGSGQVSGSNPDPHS